MSIGAKEHSIYAPFLVLECKRLPAPSKDREKEYVTGFDHTSGGIQRFKMGLYGHTHSFAVLIGYIQRENSKFWYNKIREWILELAQGDIEDQCSWDESKRSYLRSRRGIFGFHRTQRNSARSSWRHTHN